MADEGESIPRSCVRVVVDPLNPAGAKNVVVIVNLTHVQCRELYILFTVL